LQLAKLESAGSAVEKKLLVDMRSKNPEATPTELLCSFKVPLPPTRAPGTAEGHLAHLPQAIPLSCDHALRAG
jgi:hypothetical protein